VASVNTRITTHWVNGWFLRLFSRPYLVIDDEEVAVEWGKWIAVEMPEGPVQVGAGVRYTRTSELGGFKPHMLQPQSDETSGSTRRLVLRNGFWNHTPFKIESYG
jgi:hypothetical protein